jgi:hypothetical protein
MGIQLPSAERVGPQAPQGTEIYGTKVPDAAPAIAETTKAVTQFAEQYNDYQIKVEEKAIDTTSTKMTNDWEVQYRKRLAEIGQMKGDVRPHYSKLDEDSKAWVDEVLKQYPDADERLKTVYKEKVAHRSLGLNDKTATQLGTQYQKWVNDVEEANTEMIANQMVDAVAVTNDPEWEKKLDGVFNQLKENQYKLAENNGQTVEKLGEDGVVRKMISPDASLNMLKTTSRVLKSTLSVLEDTGRTEEFDHAMTKYGEHLTAKDKAELLTKKQTNHISRKAAFAVDAAMKDPKNGGDPKRISDALDKITDPQVKIAAASSYGTLLTKQKQAQDATDRRNIEQGIDYGRSQNFADISELRANPIMAKRLDRLSEKKDRDALEQGILRNKSNSLETVSRISKHLEDNTLGDLSKAELARELIGSSPEYAKKIEALHLDATTVTDSEVTKTQSVMFKKLKSIMMRDKKELGVKGSSTKPREAETARFQTALTDYVAKFPKNAKFYNDPRDAEKLVEDFAADFKRQGGFGAPREETIRNNTWGTRKVKDELPKNAALSVLKPEEVPAWIEFYNRENRDSPFNPKTDYQRMIDFRRKHNDKIK